MCIHICLLQNGGLEIDIDQKLLPSPFSSPLPNGKRIVRETPRVHKKYDNLKVKYQRTKANLDKMSTYATSFEVELVQKNGELKRMHTLHSDIECRLEVLQAENQTLKELLRAVDDES